MFMFNKPVEGIKINPVDIQNEYYKVAKAEVQAKVLEYTSLLPLEWQVEVPPLSDCSRLKERVTKSGFAIEEGSDATVKSRWDNTKPKRVMNVKLPQNPKQDKTDEGYFSDGWDKDFKASLVQRKIQCHLEQQFNSLTKLLNDHVNKNPLVNKIIFTTDYFYSPIVMQWIEEEFKKNNWGIEIERSKSFPQISSAYYAYTITCTNPANKNEQVVTYNI